MIKNFGPTFKQHCNHCGNDDYWVLTRIMTWFTLFFVPIFPYSIKYFLSCPVCQYGLTLDSKQSDELRPLAEANQLLLDGKITKEEYQVRLSLPQASESQEKVVEAEIETKVAHKPTSLKFCASCGTEVVKDVKFCGNCGAQANPS